VTGRVALAGIDGTLPSMDELAAGAEDRPTGDPTKPDGRTESTRPQVPPPPRYGRHYRPAAGAAENDDATAGDRDAAEPAQDAPTQAEPETGFVGHLQNVAEPVANAVEPFMDGIVMPMAGAIGNAIEAATPAFVKEMIGERLLRRSPEPLENLYESHPEARLASPRELGFRFVPIEDVQGTAVAGIAQRGKDFLPLPDFRGSNWEGRWKRIKNARDSLTPLPPVDLIKYQGGYWVVDGHNRVAAMIDAHGVGVDAMVVELVPLDTRASETPSSVLPFIGESGALRAAATGRAPAVGTRVSSHETPQSEMEVIDEDRSGGTAT
jgi:hypothetical protein